MASTGSKRHKNNLKAGLHLKSVVPPLNNANILFVFQVMQKRYHYYTNPLNAVFCKFWGIFGRNSFSQRIS